MSKLQTEPKLSRFKLYRQKPNKGNKTDVTLYTNSAVCTCRLCALPWRRNSLLSTHWFLRFLLSQLSTLITKNLKPKSKIRNDSLLSLTFLYHPAKFHRVSTPFGSSVWAELFLVFRPEQFPLFRLYYWLETRQRVSRTIIPWAKFYRKFKQHELDQFLLLHIHKEGWNLENSILLLNVEWSVIWLFDFMFRGSLNKPEHRFVV